MCFCKSFFDLPAIKLADIKLCFKYYCLLLSELWETFFYVRSPSQAPLSFVMSVRLCVCLSSCINAAPTRRIFIKLNIRDFQENMLRNYHT